MENPTRTRQRAPTATSMSSDLSEEPLAEVDEPPDHFKGAFCWSPPNLCSGYLRAPPKASRRESLLTRQIQSETEQTDHDEPRSPVRALSTQSTWSSLSMPSTAELTSDDGHSLPSVAGSPPPPSTQVHHDWPVVDKPAEQKVKIVGQDHVPTVADKPAVAQDPVEATLGRKRCIAFACKGKQDAKPAQPTSAPAPEPAQSEATSPPKRKCMLKFVCPSRADAGNKSTEKTETKRPVSPPPLHRQSSSKAKHRGSDATLTYLSPKQTRKVPVVDNDADDTPQTSIPRHEKRYSDESNDDSGAEATRFHEFATSDDEPEDWTQMTTCFRNRLTIDDTLKKEHIIRKTCEEVEEEALEEEEVEEEEDLDDELAAVADDDDDVEDGADEDDDTDDGFHSDDEEGFADSDSEDDGDSDFEWWKPGGLSTAATSMDQLDRLALVNSQQNLPGTSAGSTNSSQMSPQASRLTLRKPKSKQERTQAMTINRAASPEPHLPDSTDFVCGTLDEDRPLEQAFVNRRKQKLAAKRGFCPQDIDPTFPTSDPEMEDEEDDDVNMEPQVEDENDLMHGDLDEIDGDGTARRKSPIKAKPTARSPPPSATRYHSPPPKQRPMRQSPPPPARRGLARSPAPPRKLFGHSPTRMKSPAPMKRMTSPPNSPVERSAQLPGTPLGLAGRPQLTQTSSLPRGGLLAISKLATIPSDDESSDDAAAKAAIPKRGAVDIVKGLEKKRQFRKRKLAQKMNAKAASKGEKPHKVKPGTGCERMREVGLALQEYRGKAEHILSL